MYKQVMDDMLISLIIRSFFWSFFVTFIYFLWWDVMRYIYLVCHTFEALFPIYATS